MNALRIVTGLTSAILVASKSDLMTEEERRRLSDHVLQQCNEHQIRLFNFDGARVFPISIRDGIFNEFNSLQSLLLKRYLSILVDELVEGHYERFRTVILEKKIPLKYFNLSSQLEMLSL